LTEVEGGAEPGGGYRTSHVGPGVGLKYDGQFWDLTTARGINWRIEREILDRSLERFAKDGSSRALDFACGTGRVLSHLEARFAQPVGIDVSPDMLERARTRCPDSVLLAVDVTEQPRIDGTPFDVITAFRFFLNAEQPLRTQVLRWMHDALKPDGVVIANFHLNPRSVRGVYLQLRWAGRWRTPALGVRAVREMFTRSGFEVLSVTGYDFLPYRRDGSRLRAPRLRARIEQFLVNRRTSPMCAGSFIVVARPR
jgi:SAM-dependent methyltransferase